MVAVVCPMVEGGRPGSGVVMGVVSFVHVGSGAGTASIVCSACTGSMEGSVVLLGPMNRLWRLS